MSQENEILAQRLPVLLPALEQRYTDLRNALEALDGQEFSEADEARIDLLTGDLMSVLDALIQPNEEESL